MNQLVNLFRLAGRKSNRTRKNRSLTQRRLGSETLEKRQLLASDVLVAHNYLIAEDVNRDYKVTPLDALAVINQIARHGGTQNLAGMSRGDLDKFYDVSGDNKVSPLDALRVINNISRGEGLGANNEVVELRLTPLTTGDVEFTDGNKFNPASRDLNVTVGEVFNLEVGYKDLRDVPTGDLGVFQFVADIVAASAGKVEPVLTETQTLAISVNVFDGVSGDVVFTRTGITETAFKVPVATFIAAGDVETIKSAISSLYNLTPQQFTVVSAGPGVNNDKEYDIRFTDFSLANVDVADLKVSGDLKDFSNGAVTVVSTNNSIEPRLPGGAINPAAIAPNLNFKSRTYGNNLVFFGINGVFYGSYDPAVGVTGAGGVGDLVGGGVPESGPKERLKEPFDAFSLPFVATAPTTTKVEVRASSVTTNDFLIYTPVPAEARLVQPLDNLASSTTVSVDTVSGFRPLTGETSFLIKIDSEQMLVTAVNSTLKTLTVVRGQNNTTIASHLVPAVTTPPTNNVETFQEDKLTTAQIFVDLGANPAIATDGFGFVNVVAVASSVTVTANNSTLAVTEDVNAPINLLPLITVAGSSTAPTFTITTQPARGNVTVTGTTATFDPAQDDFTVAGTPLTFVYTATVGSSSDTGTITVNIAAVNDAPVFAPDTAVAATRALPKTIVGSTLLANDRPGPANETGTVTISGVTAASAQGGTVTLSGQNIVYTSAAAFTGADTITYTISDGALTTTATLTVNVTTVNTVIVTANNSTLAVTEDINATLNLSTLVTVTGSTTVPTFTITTQPARGNVTVSGTTATFDPAQDDFTVAGTPLTFVYTATVGTSSDTGTITVNITAVNDAPVFVADTAVAAVTGVAKTITGSTLLANDRPGPANETGTVTISGVTAASAQGGTVTLSGQNIVYTSAAAFTGADTITYTISDGALTTTATLTVNVTAVSIVTVTANNSTLAVTEDINATLNLSTLVIVTGSSTVPTFTITTQPSRGNVTVSGTTASFDPAQDDFTNAGSPLTFVYTATVGSVSDSGTITVNITAVNDAPVFVADTAVGATRGVALTIAGSTLSANDRPGPANETGTVTISAVTAASAQGGTVTLSGQNIVYTSAAAFTGTDTITYRISDGSLTTAATLTVNVTAPGTTTVTATNSTLAVTEDINATLNLSSLVTVTGSTTSPTFMIVTQPARGTLTLVGSSITYTPVSNDFTTTSLSFIYRAAVGSVNDTGTVTINIAAVNDSPVTVNEGVFARPGLSTTYAATVVTSNDRPGPANETGAVTLTAVAAITGTNATVGTVSLANGNIIYTPPTGFLGTDRFQYTVSDGSLTATGIVTVTVADFVPSTISGKIFTDFLVSLANPIRNGQQDPNEPAMSGLPVRLSTAGAPDVVQATDGNGNYAFTNLAPGTYTVKFDIPSSIVPIPLAPSSFQIVIATPGGLNASGNNFTVAGTQGPLAKTLDILVSRNRSSTSRLASPSFAVLSAEGDQQFFQLGDGFEDVRYAELSLNDDRDAALLTVLNDDGSIVSSILSGDNLAVGSDGKVVGLFGDMDDLKPVVDSSAVLEAEFGDYRDAIDAIIGSGTV